MSHFGVRVTCTMFLLAGEIVHSMCGREVTASSPDAEMSSKWLAKTGYSLPQSTIPWMVW